jgi:hypothetical protein
MSKSQRVSRFYRLVALAGLIALTLSAVTAIPHVQAATADHTFEFLNEFVRELGEQERISAAGNEELANASTKSSRALSTPTP